MLIKLRRRLQAVDNRLVLVLGMPLTGHNSTSFGASPERAASMLSLTDCGISLPNLL